MSKRRYTKPRAAPPALREAALRYEDYTETDLVERQLRLRAAVDALTKELAVVKQAIRTRREAETKL